MVDLSWVELNLYIKDN